MKRFVFHSLIPSMIQNQTFIEALFLGIYSMPEQFQLNATSFYFHGVLELSSMFVLAPWDTLVYWITLITSNFIFVHFIGQKLFIVSKVGQKRFRFNFNVARIALRFFTVVCRHVFVVTRWQRGWFNAGVVVCPIYNNSRVKKKKNSQAFLRDCTFDFKFIYRNSTKKYPI